jgi:phosphoenolpyruvate carboxykinase (ATP)
MQKAIFENASVPVLFEEALKRREGLVSEDGALVVHTGKFTGRSPNDKFIVQDSETRDRVWWGAVNHPLQERFFNALYADIQAYLKKVPHFVQDCAVGANPKFQYPLRVITEYAWQSMFAKTLFLPSVPENKNRKNKGSWTIISAPGFQADPKRYGLNSSTGIVLNFTKRVALIAGTHYAGEIKKSMFTVMNYLMPRQGVLSLHASATVGAKGDSALFFGLSGTGKTALSADSTRFLVGDDELGWSDDGVFNFEGGCYAKVINLSRPAEPQIYEMTRRFGTVLENVVINPKTRAVDLSDGSITENTRAAYAISSLPNAYPRAVANHPKHIFMLTCDAFGILPPFSKLTPKQAVYHFLSGYTAKLAGTERGVTEPEATFSSCFGAPFLPLHPSAYAKLLGEKLKKHRPACWLVNTGWTGGQFGTGERIAIKETRSMIAAALTNSLVDPPTEENAAFHLNAVKKCPGISATLLNPRASWKSARDYDKKARELADLFEKNAQKFS